MFVLLTAEGLVVAWTRTATPPDLVAESDQAVLVELQAPLGVTGVGDQGAVPAKEAVAAPPPSPPTHPVTDPSSLPLPPPASDPAISIETNHDAPKPVAAPPPLEAAAPAGADRAAQSDGEEDRPYASTRAISRWQLAMATRLESTKSRVHHPNGRHGTALVAFTIDPDGHLMAERLAKSSGNSALDAAARALIDAAAPYPRPPIGATSLDLNFTVPVQFQ